MTLGVPVLNEPYEFIISVERSLQKIFWNWNKGSGNNYELERIREVEQDLEVNRFNDGKVDPRGRLWAGLIMNPSYVLIGLANFWNLQGNQTGVQKRKPKFQLLSYAFQEIIAQILLP